LRVSITDRETTDSKIKLSINQRNPTHSEEQDRVQKLALNIVHAVEFSRNGRTRITIVADRSAELFVLIRASREDGSERFKLCEEELFEAWDLRAA
jgi:hypothetical protein